MGATSVELSVSNAKNVVLALVKLACKPDLEYRFTRELLLGRNFLIK
jgi:hypothetical protein